MSEGGPGTGRVAGAQARTWAVVTAVGGLLLGGCGGGVKREVARQAGELVELRAVVNTTREELGSLREAVAAVREQLEQDRRDAAAARTEADARAREMLGALAGRAEAVERRVEALGETLTGLEVSVGALADQLGRLETASGVATPLQRPGERRAATPVSPEDLFDRGMASFRAGELGQAVLDLEEFVERHPGHPLSASARFWIGEAYFRTRDFEHAAAQYQKAIEIAPTGVRSPDALLRLGLALRSLRREDRAREAWGRLLRDFPESEAAQRARVLLRQPAGAGRPGPAPESR